MFPHQGSKRRELKFIAEYQPEEFNKVIDVFGGGGNIFLHYLKQGIYSIYNDNDKALYNIVKTIDNGHLACNDLIKEAELIKEIIINNETIKRLQNDHKMTPNAAMHLALIASSKCGLMFSSISMRKINGINTIEKRKIADINKYVDILAEYKHDITNDDFYDVLEKYKNNENAFLYLDPPYMSRTVNNNSYREKDEDYLTTINKFMRDPDTKCKVMLNIDFTGTNYHIFNSMMKTYYNVRYNASNKNTDKMKNKRFHMMICNY